MSTDNDHAAHMRESAKLVDADRVRVWRDARFVMHVRVDDTVYDGVRAVRAFPLSHAAPYVSFINDKGKEVCLLTHLDALDDASREAVQDALDLNYFVPRITAVHSISESWGVSHWDVDTDCGRARFEIVDREKIRRLPGGGLVIVDADENRFMVEDLSALDPRSQNLIISET